MADPVSAAALRLAQIREQLDRWRGWAQFVYLGGGPITFTDDELRRAVCARHDLDCEELRAALARAEQTIRQGDNHHNALTCPHCNPHGLTFAEQTIREQQEEKDSARVAPSVDCVATAGSTAEGPTGAVAAAKRPDKIAAAMWALNDHLKALGYRFDSWPDAVKMAFSEAMIADDQTLPEADIRRAHTLGRRLGSEFTGDHDVETCAYCHPAQAVGGQEGELMTTKEVPVRAWRRISTDQIGFHVAADRRHELAATESVMLSREQAQRLLRDLTELLAEPEPPDSHQPPMSSRARPATGAPETSPK